MSVRRVEDITDARWGATRVSPSTVSNLNEKIHGQIEAWRNQPIEGELDADRAVPIVGLGRAFVERPSSDRRTPVGQSRSLALPHWS
jgi:hypothetical protein